VAEGATACQRRESRDQPLDEIRGMRPLRMACHLHLLPGRQLGIGLAQLAINLRPEPRHFFCDVEIGAVREMPELLDLSLELRDRLLEVEKMPHGGRSLA